MGMNDFAPYLNANGYFVVRNICKDRNKSIKIFNYPINFNTTRDLLQIPGISENDIRASLLKGELNHKLRAKDIIIENSDIDLVQFNSAQKKFLQDSGIIIGLHIDNDRLAAIRKEDIQLVGIVDGINKVFTIPLGTFLMNLGYKIIVYRNGIKQFYLDDYFIAESGGLGSGYDTVIFSVAPVDGL